MKKLFLALLLSTIPALGSVRVEWDSLPAQYTPIFGGFRVWKQDGTHWMLLSDVGTNTSWTVALDPGDYVLAVSAYSKIGLESEKSIPLAFTILPIVINVRIVQP